MKENTKKNLYLVSAILGGLCILFVLAAEWWIADLNSTQFSAVIGVGAGLFGFGIAKWWIARWSEKNPELMKQNKIEIQE